MFNIKLIEQYICDTYDIICRREFVSNISQILKIILCGKYLLDHREYNVYSA